ncbi:hypothetical protein GGR30_000550 [Martelella radicis]|uniref:Uncharacterized protein n=1 Tax=Martelella radicis TaxID=1397476 RepID=A0A7W6P8G3_9HYPH|nr:hypothetical protein [Martelella radicis]
MNVFDGGRKEDTAPAVDVKNLHAKIDRKHPLFISRQAGALGISRGSVCYLPRATSMADLALMKKMDIEAIYRRPNTLKPAPGHKIEAVKEALA